MKFQILGSQSDLVHALIKTDSRQIVMSSAIRFTFVTLLLFLNVLGLDAFAQVVFDHPVATGAATNYSTTWTVPEGINAITVEAWGGGAGGNGNFALPPQMFVGGGGGAYAKTLNYAVTPGDVLTIDIGRGGPITTGTNPNLGTSGGNTTVSKAGTVLLSACGGAPYYVIAGNYVSAACSPVNVVEYGINTYTNSGGNAGGVAFGGGLGGALGQVGIVPGGGGSGSFGVAKAGASGRVIINTGEVTINCDVTINPSSASICSGQSVSLSASGADSFTWSSEPGLSANAGSTVSANPTQTTTYTVTGTTGNCSSTRTITITVNQTPTVTINPSTASICSGQSSSLTASGAEAFSWSSEPGLSANSGSTVSANPTQTTTYTVTGTTGNCSSTRTVTITVNQSPTVTVNPSAISICAGQGTFLTANGASSYTWSNEPGLSTTTGSSVSANPTQTTTYTVTGTTESCSSTQTVTVSVKQAPTLSINSAPVCSADFSTWQIGVIASGGTVTSNAGTVSNTIANLWVISGIPAGVSANISVSSVPGDQTCTRSVSVLAPSCICPPVAPPVSGGNKIICNTSPIPSISASVQAGETVDWYSQASGGILLAYGTLSFTPANGGNFYAQTRNLTSGCVSLTRTVVNILARFPATPAFAAIGPICNGAAVTLPATSTNNIPGTWEPSAVNNTSSGSYLFTPDSGQCATTTSIDITVLPALNHGSLSVNNQTFVTTGDPSTITFQTAPSGGSAAFNYQWYSQPGIQPAPSGTSTAGWTLIPSATSASYDPAVVTASVSYAVQVDPTGSPDCGVATWANGVRQITINSTTTFSPGTLQSANQTLCFEGDPGEISFSAAPSDGSTFEWYYQDGIIGAPANTDGISGWTLILDATSPSYDPSAGLQLSRTYACRVSNGGDSQWATGVRQVTVLPAFNPGTITDGDQTFCGSGNPSPITLSSNPTGSGAYQYRWYFRETSTGACPSGGTIPQGWNTNNTSVNISGTSLNGTGLTFDPSVAGNVNQGRAFAVFITPIANGNIPACGTPQWANSCRKTFVVPCSSFEAGAVAAGNETICNAGDPATISLSTLPSDGAQVQWYFRNGIVSAPLAADPLTGWTIIPGATSPSYDPPSGLSQSRTYACRSTLSAISRWATGVRQLTVLPVFNPGIVTNADQTFCTSGNPSNITLSQNPVGSGAYQWRWYFRESSSGDCPSGSQIPQGWLTNSGATISGTSTTGAGISYDPQSAGSLNNGRSFAVLITPIANGNTPACGTPQWASSCRKLFVIPCPDFTPGSIAGGTETLCNGGDPSVISFSVFPSSGSTYRWYYQNSLVSAPNPTDPLTGWTAINSSNTANYNPPAGLTTTRTYACRVTNGANSQWATGVKQVTVLAPYSPGVVISEDQTFCNSGNPSAINLSQNPSGSGAYQYRWYFRESATGDCPSGNSIPAGWNTNNTSNNIAGTSTTGSGMSFDPISAGSVNNGRTFAVFITPISNGNSPACGTPQWASGCRKTFVIPCTGFNAGAIASGDETICNAGDPSNVYLAQVPTNGSARQWYYQDGIVPAPLSTDPTTGWTVIPGAAGLGYNPPSGLTQSRTYACRVINGANNEWAAGVRQVTVLAPVNIGIVTDGDQTFCNSGNPANITLSSDPSGSGAYQWRWYYRESSNGDCPTGSTIPAGWLTNNSSPNITGTTTTGAGISFNPISAGSIGNGRTFAVFITPIANGNSPACGTPQWATSCRKTIVNPCRMEEEAPELEIEASAETAFLGQSYPNPTQGLFSVNYFLPKQFTQGSIAIYDVTGKKLTEQSCKPGEQQLAQFDAQLLPSGTYYYSLESQSLKLATKKLIIVK